MGPLGRNHEIQVLFSAFLVKSSPCSSHSTFVQKKQPMLEPQQHLNKIWGVWSLEPGVSWGLWGLLGSPGAVGSNRPRSAQIGPDRVRSGQIGPDRPRSVKSVQIRPDRPILPQGPSGLSWLIFRSGHGALLPWTFSQELDPVGCLPPGADRRFDPKDPEQQQLEAKFTVR